MFSETTFLLVFGLGAACMLLGFVLVLRGVGASDSESTIKLIGIELRASRVGPGVLFALFGLVLIVMAMAKLQGGGGEPKAAVTTAEAPQGAAAPAPEPGAPAGAEPVAPAASEAGQSAAVPADLVKALGERNVHGSQGEASLRDWVGEEGSYYRRLGEATLAVLGPRKLTAAGVDLLKVSYFYLVERGVSDESQLPAGQPIDRGGLERALVRAHRDMNGGGAASLAEITRP